LLCITLSSSLQLNFTQHQTKLAYRHLTEVLTQRSDALERLVVEQKYLLDLYKLLEKK
jgi:hypothetical protein